MFKSTIKNPPKIIGKRLVPARNNQSSSSSVAVVSEGSSDDWVDKIDNITHPSKSQTIPIQTKQKNSYFHKMFTPFNDKKIMEASEKDIEFLHRSPKTSKHYSQKMEKQINTLQQKTQVLVSSNLKKAVSNEPSQTQALNYSEMIRIQKEKLQQCDAQIEFFDVYKREHARILQKKYIEIRALNEKIEKLLEEKEQNTKQLFSKTKKIEELTHENRFKQIKIKELQVKRQNQERKGQQSGRKRLGSNLQPQEQQNLLKKSNTDWGIKLSALKNEKDNEIIDLSNSIQIIKNTRQKQVNEIRQQYSKKMVQMENHYQTVIFNLQNNYSQEIKGIKNKFAEEIYNKEEKSKKEKQMLQKLYDSKVIDLTKIYESKLQSFKNLPAENEQAIKKINIHNQEEVKIIRQQLAKEKQLFHKSFQNTLEEERRKYNDILKIMTNRNRQFQAENDRLKIFQQERLNQLQILQKDIKRIEKSQCDKEKLIQLEKNKYKRMEDLWRDEKKKNDAHQLEKEKIQKNCIELQQRVNILSETIKNLTSELAIKDLAKQQEYEKMTKMKESYGKIIAEKNKQITLGKNNLKNQKDQLENLRDQIKGLKELIINLDEREKDLRIKNQEEIDFVLKEKQNQKYRYIDQLKTKQTEVKELNQFIEGMQKDMEKIRDNYNQMKIENTQKCLNIEKYEQDLLRKKTQIDSLQQKIEHMENLGISKQFGSIKLMVMGMGPKIEGLFAQMQRLDLMASTTSKDLNSLIDEAIEQQSDFLSLKEKVEASSSDKILQILTTKQKQNQQMALMNKKLQKQLKTLRFQLSQTKQLHETLKRRQEKNISYVKIESIQTSNQEIQTQTENQQIEGVSSKQTIDFGCGMSLETDQCGIGESNIDQFCQKQIQCDNIDATDIGIGEDQLKFYEQRDIQTDRKIQVRDIQCGQDAIWQTIDKGIQSEKELMENYGVGDSIAEDANDKSVQYQQSDPKDEDKIYEQIGVNTDIDTQIVSLLSKQGCQTEKYDQQIQVQFDQDDKICEDKKNLEDQQSDESLSNKQKISIQDDQEGSLKDDESSAKEEDQRENAEGKKVNADQVKFDEDNDETPFSEEKYDTAELLDQLQEKEYVIQQMTQCIQDYKEMVWEMKQRLEVREGYEANYREILQIFSLQTEQMDTQAHKYLIEMIKSYTTRVNEMMGQLEKMQELNNENESLNNSKKKFIKELKKCKSLIEKVEQQNEDLDRRLGQQMFKNQKMEQQIKQLYILLQTTNDALNASQARLLSQKMSHLKESQQLVKSQEQSREQKLINLQVKQIVTEQYIMFDPAQDHQNQQQQKRSEENKIDLKQECGRQKEEDMGWQENQEGQQIQIFIHQVMEEEEDEIWESMGQQNQKFEYYHDFKENQIMKEKKEQIKEQQSDALQYEKQDIVEREEQSPQEKEKGLQKKKTCEELVQQDNERQQYLQKKLTKKQNTGSQRSRRFNSNRKKGKKNKGQ